MKKLCAFLASSMVLTACNPETVPSPKDDLSSCGASNLQSLVGANVASYDFDTLDQDVRILPPGSVMTMDHRPDRLNVDLDETDQITRLWCG